jgi:hypothetical protein
MSRSEIDLPSSSDQDPLHLLFLAKHPLVADFADISFLLIRLNG